jgi:hypothetical protein
MHRLQTSIKEALPLPLNELYYLFLCNLRHKMPITGRQSAPDVTAIFQFLSHCLAVAHQDPYNEAKDDEPN